MVLNALQITAPAVPEFDPFRTFTQDNVLDALTDAVLPRDVLFKKGMTLDQLGGLLALHPLKVEVQHAGDTALEEFRASAAKYLETENHFVLVNYLRMAIGQERGGHIRLWRLTMPKEIASSFSTSPATSSARLGRSR